MGCDRDMKHLDHLLEQSCMGFFFHTYISMERPVDELSYNPGRDKTDEHSDL